MPSISKDAAHIAEALSQQAEAVCLHYLSNGHRSGHYWLVGNIQNEKGRSLYVRLNGPLSGPRAAGKWVDAATGEYGDLLDLIRLRGNHEKLSDAIAEASRFLSLPGPRPFDKAPPGNAQRRCDHDTVAAARRLFAAARPITGTLAEAYLANRSIRVPPQSALKFHPNVYFQHHTGQSSGLPALLAAVTDNQGAFKAINRIWIDPLLHRLANIPTPKKARGHLLGNAVRFGKCANILIIGEGVETVLSLKTVRPDIAMAAALSSNHLAAFELPVGLPQLLIARDRDDAGKRAAHSLASQARRNSTRVQVIVPRCKDFNDDLRQYRPTLLRSRLTEILSGLDGTGPIIDTAKESG